MNVYYQENDQPRKHWKDCDVEENVVINAAGRALQQCTNFTAAFYKFGLAAKLEELTAELEEFADMLGVKKKHPKKKNDEKGKS